MTEADDTDEPRDADRRFRSAERLGRRRDYEAVFRHRNSAAGACLIVYGVPNGTNRSRLGFSVGRRFGIAVVRNRFKRLCREAFRLTKSRQPTGWDWVVLPRKRTGVTRSTPLEWSLDEIEKDLPRLMARIAARERR